MKYALAALLHLYPPAWRDAFAEEMAAVFEESSNRSAKPWMGCVLHIFHY